MTNSVDLMGVYCKSLGMDNFEQTVQNMIRLLSEEQPDKGLFSGVNFERNGFPVSKFFP